jgi:cytochrome c553
MNRYALGVLACALALASASASAGGDPEAGQKKSVVCQTCHGPDGNSTDPQFPRLAGQHEDYLVRALTDYKEGRRKNAIMANFANPLSRRDIEDLAAHFARQRNGLFTR